MPKNPHANFTPTLAGYSGITPFRFWCQTALPLTYDDSLSYYELLNKVVNYLNHTIEDLTNVENNTSELAEAYEKLQKYVNDYFDDLDVEAELRTVLDGMAEDGTLDALLDPLVENRLPGVVDEKIDGVVASQIDEAVAGQIDESVADQLPALVDAGIPGEVSGWLTENVNPVGSAVVVDSSLTISGAAADAKVTGDELSDLKTQLNPTLNEVVNAVTKKTLIPMDYSVNSVTLYGGNTGPYNNWKSSTLKAVIPGQKYHIGAWCYFTNGINITPISYYNSNNEYIDGVSGEEGTIVEGSNRYYDAIITIPEGCAFIKLSRYIQSTAVNVCELLTYINGEYTESTTTRNKEILDTFQKLITLDLTPNQNTVPLYGGGYGSYDNWHSTDFIDCALYEQLNIVAWCYNETSVKIAPIAFYDANNNYIYGVNPSQGVIVIGSNRVYQNTVDIPSGAKFFKLSAYTGRGSSGYPISATTYGYTTKDNTWEQQLNIVCIGDSLTEGDLGADPYASAQNITPYNYPYWMRRYLDCIVTNKGKSGYTTIQAWENVVQNIDFTGVNTIIIMLGSNGGLTDTIDTDCPDNTPYTQYANTNTGDYCKIIEYTMEQAPNAQIILCTPPHISKIRGNKRTTTIQAAAVVRKIADRYELPLIDMMLRAGFNDWNESVFQPVDGLHFSIDGYKHMGTFIGSQVKSYNAIQIDPEEN